MNVTTEEAGRVSIVRVGETRLMYPILPEFAGTVGALVSSGRHDILIDLTVHMAGNRMLEHLSGIVSCALHVSGGPAGTWMTRAPACQCTIGARSALSRRAKTSTVCPRRTRFRATSAT